MSDEVIHSPADVKPRDPSEILADFSTFTTVDFDLRNEGADGFERLYDLVEELFKTPHPELGMEVMFQTIERLPEADLGSPGPLVHGIERLDNYEPRLIQSVQKQPTPLNIWMINRILNTHLTPEHRTYLMNVMKDALSHPLLNEETERDIKGFIKYQENEGNH